MTWTLKSGRVIHDDPRDLCMHRDEAWRILDIEELNTEPRVPWIGRNDGSPLTPAERREIAEAVKQAWDRWASP